MFTDKEFNGELCSIVSSEHYLTKSCATYDDYTKGLYESLKSLHNIIGKKKCNNFRNKKLQFDQEKFNEKQYIQSACELTVMSYFLQNKYNFKYENKLSPPKDVDFSIVKNKRNINVEVKCPSYVGQIKPSGSTHSIKCFNRAPDQKIQSKVMSYIEDVLYEHDLDVKIDKNMDNNFKDFLISTQEKVKLSDKDDFNILVVSCDDAMDMMNWRGYLYNNKGFFTKDSYIAHEKYDRVDFVLLTNLYNRHHKHYRHSSITNHWDLSESFNLLYNNGYSKKIITRKDYDFVSSIFPNMTVELEEYLKDKNNIPEGEESSFIKENILGIDFFLEQPGHQDKSYFTNK